ncbi:zf-HC2 domain-containing protein [Halomonas qaidamensis]|uniref:Zf-HC2 domain-containing protein n=1 Tax=Halomonas qaidamensis TaxID=2866211 RepID=A0ABY6JS31_9GAMM|nr:zf-HC2 domain-containing protein [Halomonas qaidamensis]UYV20068.1 zf-HC2 domain-containing protein [Halomonas qaidamensis]
MIMCREATRLMSLKQDRTLTFRENTALRFHLSMCGACRACMRQFDLLHKIASHHPSLPNDATERGDHHGSH